jgi:lipid-A-disaccharide synthase-like uncharacterized protein
VFEIFGIAGIAISVAAYAPQILHLWRERCSAGVSSRAWAMWLAGGVLVGVLAVHRRDPVFMMLQASNVTAVGLILFLAWRYRDMVCETHGRVASRVGGATAEVRTSPNPRRHEGVFMRLVPLGWDESLMIGSDIDPQPRSITRLPRRRIGSRWISA